MALVIFTHGCIFYLFPLLFPHPTGIVTEGCVHNGHYFEHGESWSVGYCKRCQCKNGWAHCIMQQHCLPDEVRPCLTTTRGIMMPGERWDEDDCTMCECVDGAPACMTSSCVVKCLNPVKVPGICCPVCDSKLMSVDV